MTKHRGQKGLVLKEMGLAGARGGRYRVDRTGKGGTVSSEGHDEANLRAHIQEERVID